MKQTGINVLAGLAEHGAKIAIGLLMTGMLWVHGTMPMWIYATYRWPSEADWRAALAAEGWTEGTPSGVDLLVSGRLYAPPVDAETPGAALPGWHVAAAFRGRAAPVAWAGRAIAAPEGMPVLGRVPRPRVLSVLDFRDRLTPEEEVSITSAGMASPAVRVWLDRLSGAQEVNLDDPRTVAGLQSMEAAGLLAPGRAAEVLA